MTTMPVDRIPLEELDLRQWDLPQDLRSGIQQLMNRLEELNLENQRLGGWPCSEVGSCVCATACPLLGSASEPA